MGGYAIRAEGLSKRYRIGQARRRDGAAAGGSGRHWRLPRLGMRPDADAQFWALNDVTFEVRKGEAIGIIGGNGAGKSTLLKILSRITRPTAGTAELRGRVGSLLEVGSGFHPELTGRENVFLNGAILGMSRAEIRRKFDEIVAFAGTEQFLETPVKRYSSGMYVRLAFAVAAHLDPEILIVDEVLAVGDASFQRKCLGKMGEAARGGRTVLFVSHNLAVVQSLCTRGLFLRGGRVECDGTADEAVSAYLRTLERLGQVDLAARTDRRGVGRVKLVGLSITGPTDEEPPATGEPARIVLHFDDIMPGMTCDFTIYDEDGRPIANFNSAEHGPADATITAPGPQFICEIDELSLTPGNYRIDVATLVGQEELLDHLEAAATFDVEPGRMRGRPVRRKPGYGSTSISHRWLLAPEVNPSWSQT
jgi:homopolymeric O-antigen transport system ATP-binding protein